MGTNILIVEVREKNKDCCERYLLGGASMKKWIAILLGVIVLFILIRALVIWVF